MMSTQTQPATPDADEPTVIVTDEKATALAGLGWSDAEDYDAAFDDLRDHTTLWLRFFVGITAAVVVILAIVLWSVLSEHQAVEEAPAAALSAPDVIVPSSPPAAAPAPIPSEEPAPPPPVIAAPPPVSTEAPPPPPRPTTPDPNTDSEFLNSLNRAGITINDAPTAIRGGHAVCTYIVDDGHTPREAAEKARQTSPSLSVAQAETYIAISVESFCPQAGR